MTAFFIGRVLGDLRVLVARCPGVENAPVEVDGDSPSSRLLLFSLMDPVYGNEARLMSLAGMKEVADPTDLHFVQIFGELLGLGRRLTKDVAHHVVDELVELGLGEGTRVVLIVAGEDEVGVENEGDGRDKRDHDAGKARCIH